MTVLKVLVYPEKSLLQPSVKVDNIDDELRQLIDNMGETMFDAPGVGLAAPQVGINKRVIVYDVNARSKEDDETPEIKEEFRALINPEIISASGSTVSKEEGCLSVLDYNADVKRYGKVSIRASFFLSFYPFLGFSGV